MKSTINQSDPIMSLNEAAEYLGLSRSTLYRLVWSKSVAFSRIGRVLRFRRSALDALLTAGRAA
jgi:excisionase family DNA binding protein